jgi:chitinase
MAGGAGQAGTPTSNAAGTSSTGVGGASGNGVAGTANVSGSGAGGGAVTSAGAAGSSSGGTTAAGAGGMSSAGVSGSGGNGGGAGHPFVDPRDSEYCDEQPLYLGEMRLLTNEWTDPAAETCVFLDQAGVYGWRWQRGATGLPPNPTYPNYPEVEFGINPWNTKGIDESTTTLLPLQLKDISSASMSIDVHTDVGGNDHGWNLAFELWLSDKDPTLGPANPKGEIMVFLSNSSDYYPQAPETDQTLDDGAHSYKLYVSSDNWGTWGYYRQYRLDTHDGKFTGKLNIGAFLKHYVEQEHWDANLWVTRFELGNEVYQNTGGTTKIKNLSFEVNGQTRQAVTE